MNGKKKKGKRTQPVSKANEKEKKNDNRTGLT